VAADVHEGGTVELIFIYCGVDGVEIEVVEGFGLVLVLNFHLLKLTDEDSGRLHGIGAGAAVELFFGEALVGHEQLELVGPWAA
jgi:hypothetical protein